MVRGNQGGFKGVRGKGAVFKNCSEGEGRLNREDVGMPILFCLHIRENRMPNLSLYKPPQ